jgi:hypothetical protein
LLIGVLAAIQFDNQALLKADKMSMANRIEPVLAIKIEPLFQGYDA